MNTFSINFTQKAQISKVLWVVYVCRVCDFPWEKMQLFGLFFDKRKQKPILNNEQTTFSHSYLQPPRLVTTWISCEKRKKLEKRLSQLAVVAELMLEWDMCTLWPAFPSCYMDHATQQPTTTLGLDWSMPQFRWHLVIPATSGHHSRAQESNVKRTTHTQLSRRSMLRDRVCFDEWIPAFLFIFIT